MTTLGKLAEQILRRYKAGNPTDDTELDRREVQLLVIQAVTELIKAERMTVNLPMGEHLPPHFVIATYTGISVTDAETGYSKATLPVQPISLPRCMGVWRVYSSDDPFNPFIPVQPGEFALTTNISHNNLDTILGDKTAYEVFQNNELRFNKAAAVVGATVNMQLLVVDPAKVGEYDTLPVPADMQYAIIEKVLNTLQGTPETVDRVADLNDQR